MNIHEILLRVGGEARGAKDALRDASQRMREFGREKATAEAEVDIGSAIRDIEILLAQLSRVDGMNVEPHIKLNATAQMVQLLALKKVLGDLDEEQRRTSSGMARFKRSLSDLGQTLKPNSVHIGAFTFSLSRAGIMVLFVAGAIVKSLVAALAALAASLTQAVGGLGALAVAAAAATGPVFALAVGAISRFTSAKDAMEQLAAATDRLRQAEQAQADAERGLTAAQRQQVFAQQALARTRREAAADARDTVAQALEAVATAEEAVSDAQASSLLAQEELNEARAEALRQLEDLKLAAEGAALGEERAALNLQRARNELRRLENELGVPNMRLRDARLSVEEAELALEEARQRNTRSQEDLNEAERQGIEGSDIVVAARRSLADANEAVTETTLELADAQRESVQAQRDLLRRNEAIVSSRHALSDATRGVADAERRVAEAHREVAKAQKEVNDLQREARAIGPGTAAHDLLNAARDFRRAFQFMTAAGSDRIFSGIADALERMGPLLHRLRDDFTGLGEAIGDSFRKMGQEFTSPHWARFFERMTDLARAITPLATKSFLRLSRILANIAQASAPFLKDLFRAMSESLDSIADSSDDIGGLRLIIGELVDHLRSWWNLIKQVGRLWLNFTIAAGPAGRELADSLAEMVGGMADFLASAEGKETIGEFFEDMLPLALAVIGLLAQLIRLFLQITQLVSPALTPIIKVLGKVLDVLNDIIGKVQKLPGFLQLVVAGFVLFVGPLTILRRIWGMLRLILGALAFGRWSALLLPIAGLFSRLGAAARFAFGWMGRVAALAAGRLLTALRGLIGLGVAGAMRAIGVRMLALAAAGGPIGVLIAALILLIVYWDDVKEAIGGAVDKLKSWMDVQRIIRNDDWAGTLQDAADAMTDFSNAVDGQGRRGGRDKIGRAGQEAGKAALEGFSEGLRKAARDVGKSAQLDLATPLASHLKHSLSRGKSKQGDGFTMNNTFVTAGTRHADDREAVAAISRRLRQRGLSIA